jgi:hypothetical protein
MKDTALKVTKALPAAAATANSDSIDLGQVTAYPINRLIKVNASLPALASLVDAKTAILTLQDSADNSSFAAITGVATLTSTGAGGAGAAAQSLEVVLPDSTRQYVRGSVAVLAAGGDNTASSFTVELDILAKL